jgi:hypothetical protein
MAGAGEKPAPALLVYFVDWIIGSKPQKLVRTAHHAPYEERPKATVLHLSVNKAG